VARRIGRIAAQRRRARRAGHAVVRAADAGGCRAATDRARLDPRDGARGVRRRVAGQEEHRGERQSDARGSRVADHRPNRRGGDRVQHAHAGGCAARVRDREWATEETPGRRAGAVAAGGRRGRATHRGRLTRAGRDRGDRLREVRHRERQRDGVATAAGVEAGAREVRHQDSHGVDEVAAVTRRIDGGEAEGHGIVAARRDRRRRRARGRGGRGARRGRRAERGGRRRGTRRRGRPDGRGRRRAGGRARRRGPPHGRGRRGARGRARRRGPPDGRGRRRARGGARRRGRADGRGRRRRCARGGRWSQRRRRRTRAVRAGVRRRCIPPLEDPVVDIDGRAAKRRAVARAADREDDARVAAERGLDGDGGSTAGELDDLRPNEGALTRVRRVAWAVVRVAFRARRIAEGLPLGSRETRLHRR